MSSPSPFNRRSRFRKAFRDLTTAPRLDLSDLMTVVQAVAEASTALSPLQPAAGGLLKAIKMVEVWFFSVESDSISVVVGLAEQKSGQNAADIVELSASFSKLVETLKGPLRDTEACSPAL